MPDPRFFEDLGPVTLQELAAATGAELGRSDDGGRLIRGVAVLSQAGPDTVTFLSDRKLAPALAGLTAGACFLDARYADQAPAGCAVLITPNPQAAYAAAAERLHRPRRLGAGPAIAPDARLEEGVVLGPGVVVGSAAQIGRGTVVGANTVIGPGVAIGRDCEIGPNAAIGFALIGDRVKLYAGVVIGEPGFGATVGAAGLVDIPQLGRVIIQDGVTIGANSCVDRGAFEDTVVGENTKIDNMVQIAHNVRIGRNCALAAHSGLSGSVVLGDGVQVGGRVGIADHVKVGSGARVAGAAGVMRDIPAGETWGGLPAVPIRQWMREVAWTARQAARREGADE